MPGAQAAVAAAVVGAEPFPRRRRPPAAAAAALLLAAAALGCQQRESAAHLVLPATSVVETNEVRGVVTADSLRVRAQPSVRAEVLSYLRRGEVVEVVGRGEQQERIDGTPGYWLEVSYQGVRGWAFGSHLELAEPGAAAGEVSARVRAARGGD